MDSGQSAAIRALAMEAVTAYRAGLARPPESRFDLARLFSSKYLLRMARALTLAEISTLLEAEVLRESGLSLARSGDFVASAHALAQTRSICHNQDLSAEATLAAETFQSAAEAYLY